MTLSELFLSQLEVEGPTTRRTLERVPEGIPDWRPHPKSMPLGYLATLVADLPFWAVMTINQDSLDLQPPDGAKYTPKVWTKVSELLATFDENIEKARAAIKGATDEHLSQPWSLKVGGHVVSTNPRYVVIRDAVFSHLAHHRGQLTVYLRLNDKPVPSIYGPSADERQQF
jgi:uncharacterized damage-inducible protein DinB